MRVAIAVLAVLAGVAVLQTGALAGLEREALRARFEVRGAERPSDIAIVAVDAKTFSDLELQWPFRRTLHARVIRRIQAARPAALVYDVQFTEPTRPRDDLALFDALAGTGGAVLATSESDGRGGTNVLGGEENLRRARSRAAASDLNNDGSGAITRFPREVGGLPSIGVAGAARAGGPRRPAGAFDDEGLAWIDYRGPPGTIQALSFSDVLRGRADVESLRGKVVVVGASAPTLRDVHSTPVGGDELMAGAEVQANAIWSALHGLPLRSAPAAVNLLLILAFGIAAPLARARLSVPAIAFALPAVGLAYLAGAQLAFQAGVIVEVTAPLAALLVSGAATIAWSHVAESRARHRVTRDNELLERRVAERTRELRETQLEIAQRLGVAVEWRDADTGAHIDRMGRFCERLALAVRMPAQEAELLRHASALHDVGKVGIPDSILLKPGKLDAEEWATMQGHTTIGGAILAGSRSPLVRMAEVIALTHHERWNGSGYPRGLKGEEIPLAGRICAVCDVFEALLSPRPYKDPWPLDDVLAELERQSGAQFDPRLVEAFLPLAAGLHREWFEQPPLAA
ncbi:MAG: CHASE2 domain-containing protein [Thermoleophilaceae bacterium]